MLHVYELLYVIHSSCTTDVAVRALKNCLVSNDFEKFNFQCFRTGHSVLFFGMLCPSCNNKDKKGGKNSFQI